MRFLFNLLLTLVLFFFTDESFSQQLENKSSAISQYNFKTLPSGLQFVIQEEGIGRKVIPGDLLEIHLKGTLPDASVFASTYKENKTLRLVAGVGRMIPGLDEGILYLKEGSKAVFKIPSNLGYGETGLGSRVPPGSDILMEIKVVQILPNKYPVTPFELGDADTLISKGIPYIPVTRTKAAKPGKKDVVFVNYIAYLPDGRIFDTSIPNKEAFEFQLGDPEIIKGWNEGVALMRVGEKFRFLIPWKLAYGKKGYPPKIPPKTDLIFDIELVEISHAP
ncbi:MAG: FKBP-type peptidyl-prolyl cis-trans isomerase [Bacteroidales bacterium]|nr:FKBP-type peptidyl-prolyl cis-trans isomerase [Bacteroidales bacterium]